MLNEQLYKAIWKAFNEEPHIVNENTPAAVSLPSPVASFLPRETEIPFRNIVGGEQYTVNCPFCGDRRHRLYFSYMWNQRFVSGRLKYRASKHLIRCFNEECQKNEDNFKKICQMVISQMGKAKEISLSDLSRTTERPAFESIKNQVKMPSITASLSNKGVPSFIRRYVKNRGWDLKELEEEWGVVAAIPDFPLIKGEDKLQHPILIIPVYQYGNYWFWQGRLVPLNGELDGDLECKKDGEEYPRYIIPKGAQKRWALYNIDDAVKFDEIAIVEGATDCWSIGKNSVCSFGKTLSPAQLAVLRNRARGKRIVLIPDRDDSDDKKVLEIARHNQATLNSFKAFESVDIALLPSGSDPGDLIKQMKKGEVWRFIKSRIHTEASNIFIPGGNRGFR